MCHAEKVIHFRTMPSASKDEKCEILQMKEQRNKKGKRKEEKAAKL